MTSGPNVRVAGARLGPAGRTQSLGRAGRARVGVRGRVVVPSLLAGVLIALALPPWGFWVLAFAGAGLLWWRLRGLRLRARLLAGFCAGVGMFVPGLWWVTSFNTYGGIVLMLLESIAPALACAVVPGRTRGRSAALAGAMVLTEVVRASWPFGGLPIGGVALGQAGGPVAGAARLGGPLLLVCLVWLGGAGLALLVTPLVRSIGDGPGVAGVLWRRGGTPSVARSFSTPRRRGPMEAGLLLLAVVVGVSVWGALAPDGGQAVRTLRVAAVQGGGVRGLRQSDVDPTVVYDAQFAATAEIAGHDAGRPPSLVLWPEDVVALDGPLARSPEERQLSSQARRLRATLVVGVTEDVPDKKFRNEVVAFSPSGALVATFEKVHRVPFGEYVPDRAFFSHLANLSSVPLDAIPGRGNGVLHTPAGPLGAMISYEVFYADRGRIATRAGAQVLIDPTNTSSYLTSQVPTQEIAAARLQAIAEGRDVVQSAPTGFSALIDHRGDVLARSALAVRTVIVGDVSLRTGHTLYEEGGDLPVLVLSALLVVGGWAWAAAGPDDDRLPRGRTARLRNAARFGR